MTVHEVAGGIAPNVATSGRYERGLLDSAWGPKSALFPETFLAVSRPSQIVDFVIADVAGIRAYTFGSGLTSRPSVGRRSQLDESYRRLERLAELADDWDSYGGAAPTMASLRATRSLLSALDQRLGYVMRLDIAPSHIAPLPTGGVQLEWVGSSRELEVEVGDDGELAYLMDDRSRDERRFIEDEGVPVATVLDIIAGILVA